MSNRVNLPVRELPDMPDNEPLRELLSDIRTVIEVREGRSKAKRLQQSVTFQDLIDMGLITASQVPS